MIQYLRKQLLKKAQKAVDALGVGPLKGNISDGCHTFDDLYMHRNTLFLALCKQLHLNHKHEIFKVVDDNDPAWFIVGINSLKGKQITYHLPIKFWKQTDYIKVKEHFTWDRHTPEDVLERISKL